MTSDDPNIPQLQTGVFNAELFAKEVGFYRRHKKESLRFAAKQIGVSASTLSRIECGEKPDIDTFFRICKWGGLEIIDVRLFYKVVLPDEALEIIAKANSQIDFEL